MSWLVSALVVVWLVPPVLVAIAALACSFSGACRTWLDEVLFGESLPNARPAASPQRAGHTADRQAQGQGPRQAGTRTSPPVISQA